MKSFLVPSFLSYFRVFRELAGNRLIVLLLVIMTTGFTDGVSIALFLPLFSQFGDTQSAPDQITLLFNKILSSIHIEPSFNIVLFVLVLAFILKAGLSLVQETLVARILARLTRDLRLKLMGLYRDMRYDFYQSTDTGYLSNAVTKECERAVSAFGHFAGSIVAFTHALIYAAFLLVFNWQASLLAMLSGSLLFYTLNFLNSLSKKYSLLESEKNASLQSFLIQTIENFKYLKSTRSFDRISPKVNYEIESLADCVFRLSFFAGLLKAIKEPAIAIITLAVLFFQVTVLNQQLSSVLFVVLVIYRLVTRLFLFQQQWQKFNATVGGIDTFRKTADNIALNLEIIGSRKSKTFNSEIRLQNVHLNVDDKRILSHVNMSIKKDQIVAIVGESGAGKSTLVDLITGLIMPTAGKICFDKLPYSSLDLNHIRGLIGYVTQESVVFSDTIRNNISLWTNGSEKSSYNSNVVIAAKNAYCDVFINAKPERYDSLIGDHGIKLSGGERQRLAIARELFKNPQILILDEATSSLDTISEQYIQKSIAHLKGKLTLIVISHRLSSIKGADYIYFLDKGTVVAQGSFDHLLKLSEKFRHMYLTQSP